MDPPAPARRGGPRVGGVTTRPTVAVVGAGPAALAAVHRLRTEPGVRVVLVAPGGTAEYLPGALSVATGDAAAERYRTPVRLAGVEVVPEAADGIGTGSVRVGDTDVAAQAVIAAPGLALAPVGDADDVLGFWDLDGAARAAPAVAGFERGVLGVVIASPLYRCPPAPYGLAIRLARRAARLDLPVRVRLTTPEPRPLAGIGSEVSGFLVASCADAGVELELDVRPDPAALASGHVVYGDGAVPAADLALVVPPHRTHQMLAALAGPTPLVPVDDGGRTAEPGVYVAGDAVAGPYPRATAPAVLSGVAAAEAALADLGFDTDAGDGAATTPQLECFVDQGAGHYGRLQLDYPYGPPPGGRPSALIDPSAPARTGGFDAALDRWRAGCSDS